MDGRNLREVINEVRELFPELTVEDILEGVQLLDEEGFIEETFKDNGKKVPERYKPNVNYFSRFIGTEKNRYDIQQKISNTTILLLGLGGGGSNILTLLAGLGPKKVIILDYDIVEEGNLGRQLLYREKDIGKLKTEVALRALKEMNSTIEIEAHNLKITTPDDVLAFAEGIDLVICAIDEPPFIAQRIVNQAIVRANLPCVFGASQVSRGRVYTVIPKVTGCFDCLNLHATIETACNLRYNCINSSATYLRSTKNTR
ncbi:ThiF family adenylyltransferase [Bacillales bacterium AN1005]